MPQPETTTRERPILMSAPMVRAILSGEKTQTRRVLKRPEYYGCPTGDCPHSTHYECDAAMNSESVIRDCPYGKPGDRLWVKEALVRGTSAYQAKGCPTYAIDGKGVLGGPGFIRTRDMIRCGPWPWKVKHLVGRYMPRWAARIFLEITDVRVQRLQDISEADAIAEGIERVSQCGILRCSGWKDYTDHRNGYINPITSFWSLWASINGDKAWDANPWVWAISFKKVEATHG